MKQIRQFIICIILIPFMSGCGTLHDAAVDGSANPTIRVPNFTVYDVEGKKFSKGDLNYGQSVLFYYVDPKCSHCHDQTIWLKQELENMQHVQVLLISSRKRALTEKFFQRYAFDDYHNIKILYDKNKSFSTIFEIEEFPHLMLYDSNGSYITGFTGLTEMATVNNAFLNHK